MAVCLSCVPYRSRERPHQRPHEPSQKSFTTVVSGHYRAASLDSRTMAFFAQVSHNNVLMMCSGTSIGSITGNNPRVERGTGRAGGGEVETGGHSLGQRYHAHDRRGVRADFGYGHQGGRALDDRVCCVRISCDLDSLAAAWLASVELRGKSSSGNEHLRHATAIHWRRWPSGWRRGASRVSWWSPRDQRLHGDAETAVHEGPPSPEQRCIRGEE